MRSFSLEWRLWTSVCVRVCGCGWVCGRQVRHACIAFYLVGPLPRTQLEATAPLTAPYANTANLFLLVFSEPHNTCADLRSTFVFASVVGRRCQGECADTLAHSKPPVPRVQSASFLPCSFLYSVALTPYQLCLFAPLFILPQTWAAAVKTSADTLAHVSNLFHTKPAAELAQRLVKNSFADRVFFCNSGTEANEAAIKFARKWYEKRVCSIFVL